MIDNLIPVPDDIKVRSQPTPNPHATKFIINNKPVKVEGKVSFRSIDNDIEAILE